MELCDKVCLTVTLDKLVVFSYNDRYCLLYIFTVKPVLQDTCI
jgi:hypothetical protein